MALRRRARLISTLDPLWNRLCKFALDHKIDLVRFQKGQRKGEKRSALRGALRPPLHNPPDQPTPQYRQCGTCPLHALRIQPLHHLEQFQLLLPPLPAHHQGQRRLDKRTTIELIEDVREACRLLQDFTAIESDQ